MKTKLIIAVRIAVTLLLVAPVVLLAIENLACMGPIKNPRQELVGAWDIEANTHDGKLRFRFNIHKDGTVEGKVEEIGRTIGSVATKDAYLKRNRHWFSKLLGQRRDYKIQGRLERSPTEEPPTVFWIEFNLDKKGVMTRIKAGLSN